MFANIFDLVYMDFKQLKHSRPAIAFFETQKGDFMDKHLSLSFELIYLMGWLLKHEKGMLNSLVKHALKNGLAQDLENVHFDQDNDSSKELQAIILDFLSFLERSLAKNLDANDAKLNAKHESENHADDTAKAIDIKTRLQRAKQLLAKELTEEKSSSSKKNNRESMFNQMLKNWKPNKSDLVH